MGAPYTPDELERALALSKIMTWEEVATHFPGRKWQGLSVTARQYRRGNWNPAGSHSKRARKNALCEELVASGVTKLKPIAEALGVSVWTAHYRLMLLGLDAEMRRSNV